VVEAPGRTGRGERQRRTGAVLVVAIGMVFGSLLAAAVFHGLLASGQANLDQLDADLQGERAALAQDKLELANLQSPQRIATEAEAMGMHPADRQHWVSAADGETTTVERTPNGDAPDPDAPADAPADAGGGTDDATTSELASGTDATTSGATTTDDGMTE
jgi:type II secretory pathway pseudopilin PulG